MVIDADGVILGGNMRFKALQHLGFKEVPDEWVKRADELTEDERRRFIIADNVSGGDWDVEDLAANWDREELDAWGLDSLPWSGVPENNMTEYELDLDQEFDPIGISKDQQRVVFIFETSEDAETYLVKNNIDYKKQNIAWQVNMTSLSI